jgi:hypothetical protein
LFYIIFVEVFTAAVAVDTAPSGFLTWVAAGLATEVALLGLFIKTIFEEDY